MAAGSGWRANGREEQRKPSVRNREIVRQEEEEERLEIPERCPATECGGGRSRWGSVQGRGNGKSRARGSALAIVDAYAYFG